MPFHYELFTKEPIPVLIERFQKKFEEPSLELMEFFFNNPYTNPSFSPIIRGTVGETGFQISREKSNPWIWNRNSFRVDLNISGQFEQTENGTKINYSIGLASLYSAFFWKTFLFFLVVLVPLSNSHTAIFAVIIGPLFILFSVLSFLTEIWCLKKAVANIVQTPKLAN